jgi:hypothetical protein
MVEIQDGRARAGGDEGGVLNQIEACTEKQLSFDIRRRLSQT